MSNPAIVLMTDPSRCSLGDVHYLLQALLEIQQMGEHASPQAFCDHPAAAKGFIAAYAHAYPKLVLEDSAIPTPDHLQSLIGNGQIGAFGQPSEPAAPAGQVGLGGPLRPAEQTAANTFPIVVLTLGSAQLLADALQQNASMRESVRLIDIAPDGTDGLPVSIADALAIGGLEGAGTWDGEGLGTGHAELDDVAGATITDPVAFALDDDPIDLGGVEAAHATGAAAIEPDREDVTEATASANTAADTPEPGSPVVATATEEVREAAPVAPAAAPVAEVADTLWPAAEAPAVAEAPVELSEELPPAGEDGGTDDSDPDGEAPDGQPPESKDTKDEDSTEPDVAVANGLLDGEDVDYPPVGDLVAGADVFYPALDPIVPPGALEELAGVMLDDAIFDVDLAAMPSAIDDDGPFPARAPAHEEAVRSSEHLVTVDELYGASDPDDDDDAFGGSAPPQPSHDNDL